MDSNHQFGLPYHAVTIHTETPASLKTHNNFNAHSARPTLWCRSFARGTRWRQASILRRRGD
jgi:hypothetical protein